MAGLHVSDLDAAFARAQRDAAVLRPPWAVAASLARVTSEPSIAASDAACLVTTHDAQRSPELVLHSPTHCAQLLLVSTSDAEVAKHEVAKHVVQQPPFVVQPPPEAAKHVVQPPPVVAKHVVQQPSSMVQSPRDSLADLDGAIEAAPCLGTGHRSSLADLDGVMEEMQAAAQGWVETSVKRHCGVEGCQELRASLEEETSRRLQGERHQEERLVALQSLVDVVLQTSAVRAESPEEPKLVALEKLVQRLVDAAENRLEAAEKRIERLEGGDRNKWTAHEALDQRVACAQEALDQRVAGVQEALHRRLELLESQVQRSLAQEAVDRSRGMGQATPLTSGQVENPEDHCQLYPSGSLATIVSDLDRQLRGRMKALEEELARLQKTSTTAPPPAPRVSVGRQASAAAIAGHQASWPRQGSPVRQFSPFTACRPEIVSLGATTAPLTAAGLLATPATKHRLLSAENPAVPELSPVLVATLTGVARSESRQRPKEAVFISAPSPLPEAAAAGQCVRRMESGSRLLLRGDVTPAHGVGVATPARSPVRSPEQSPSRPARPGTALSRTPPPQLASKLQALPAQMGLHVGARRA